MGNCNNAVVVSATKESVWKAIADFHDLSWAPNVIEKIEIVGDKKGRELGARRVLNDAFHETLTVLDPANYTIEYTIDNGPGPLESDSVELYTGKVQLKNSGDKTEVVWTSEFKANDEAGIAELCNPVYQALLGDLAKHFS